MGRIIKFRSWLKEKEEMLYNFGTISNHPIVTESKKNVLMQYTGFKDRKENEIYEGDILHLDAHQDMQIKFIDGCFVAVSTNRIQELNWTPSNLVSILEMGYEVIGNICENSDLISS